nr:unnamed protein product [Callosobruchus analis]
MAHFRHSRNMTEQLANRFELSEYFHRQEGNSLKVTPQKFIIVFLWSAKNQAASYRDVSDRFYRVGHLSVCGG